MTYISLTSLEKKNFSEKTSMLNLDDLKYLHYELTIKILNNQSEIDNKKDGSVKEINY